MTDSTNNYNQLLELAVLDAHGLLEPIEADLFTKSFHNAPAAIQDEIIRLQRDFALDTALLPSETPPASLKQKVLHAVAQCRRQRSKTACPSCAHWRSGRCHVQGAIGYSKSTNIWRIAAMLLFGVSVILGITAVDTQRRINNITHMAMNLDAQITITEFVGAEFNAFINNPYCHVTRLERERGNQDGYLRIATNEFFGGGHMMGIDLEPGEEIIIQGTTASGEVIELVRFTAEHSIAGRAFDIEKSLIPGLQIIAINAKTGERWI